MATPQERYEVIEAIGSGATSRVDKARDNVIGRTVALKTFVQGFGSRDLQQQFLREAQIVGGLSHPNIVALYDVGTNQDGNPYFVMEYVEGKTLDSALHSAPLPLQLVGRWGGDLAIALSQAHRAKIIHGDIKPENILVTLDDQIKLGDFGIARMVNQVSVSGTVMGTPAYLSPEQILARPQDSRTDIFSLGIVLYQMATGFRPFDGDSVGAVCAQIISSEPIAPSARNPLLPPAFDQLVMRCLSKNAEERFPTAESLAAALYPFARNHSQTQPEPQTQVAHQSRIQPQRRVRPRAGDTTAQVRTNQSWWTRPFRWKESWPIAAGILALALSIPILGAVRKHASSVLPSAPVLAASAPPTENAVTQNQGFPHESAFPVDGPVPKVAASTNADTGLSREEHDSSPALAEPKSPATVSSVKTVGRPKTSKNSEKASSPNLSQMRPASPSATDPLSNAAKTKSGTAAAPFTTTMHIEIVSAVTEGRLTIFSGQEVLLSAKLATAHAGEPLRFDCPLPPGPHALRVALYRSDDSLQLQKEGFAEIASGSSSALDIHINNRRSKFLVRKELTLEVIWPGPNSGAAQETSSLAPASTVPATSVSSAAISK